MRNNEDTTVEKDYASMKQRTSYELGIYVILASAG